MPPTDWLTKGCTNWTALFHCSAKFSWIYLQFFSRLQKKHVALLADYYLFG